MRITWLFLSVCLSTVPAFANGWLNNESAVVAQVKGQGVAEGGTNATSGRLSYSAFYHGLFLTSRSLRQNEMSLGMERLRVMQDECYRLSVLAGYSLLDESVQRKVAPYLGYGSESALGKARKRAQAALAQEPEFADAERERLKRLSAERKGETAMQAQNLGLTLMASDSTYFRNEQGVAGSP